MAFVLRLSSRKFRLSVPLASRCLVQGRTLGSEQLSREGGVPDQILRGKRYLVGCVLWKEPRRFGFITRKGRPRGDELPHKRRIYSPLPSVLMFIMRTYPFLRSGIKTRDESDPLSSTAPKRPKSNWCERVPEVYFGHPTLLFLYCENVIIFCNLW